MPMILTDIRELPHHRPVERQLEVTGVEDVGEAIIAALLVNLALERAEVVAHRQLAAIVGLRGLHVACGQAVVGAALWIVALRPLVITALLGQLDPPIEATTFAVAALLAPHDEAVDLIIVDSAEIQRDQVGARLQRDGP